MSMISAVFNLLSSDQELAGMLAKHSLAPDYPAIYENWATEDIPTPYIVLSYSFNDGDSLAKTNSFLLIDIFTDGPSTIQAETIRNRLKTLLGWRRFSTLEEGPIRSYYVRDGNVPEETPDVTHWNMEFNLVYFNVDYITAWEPEFVSPPPTEEPVTNEPAPPPPDRDGDGIPDAEDPYPDDPTNTPPPPDYDGDGIPDSEDYNKQGAEEYPTQAQFDQFTSDRTNYIYGWVKRKNTTTLKTQLFILRTSNTYQGFVFFKTYADWSSLSVETITAGGVLDCLRPDGSIAPLSNRQNFGNVASYTPSYGYYDF